MALRKRPFGGVSRALSLLALTASVAVPAAPAGGAPVPSTAASPPETLAVGTARTASISAGETLRWTIPLEAGQYARVTVDQREADVVVTLASPRGVRIATSDAPGGERTPESIAVLAEESGRFVVEVRSKQSDPKARSIEITLQTVRAAAAGDSERIQAERLFAEGERLRGQGGEANLHAAIARYEEAAAGAESAGDDVVAARALRSLAWTTSLLGENAKAIEQLDRALVIARRSGDPWVIGTTLHTIGAIDDTVGEADKALKAYEEALVFRRQLKDRRGEAVTLSNMALVYGLHGEPKKALEQHTQALEGMREMGDPVGEGSVLVAIGADWETLGEKLPALDAYRKARAVFHAIPETANEALALQNIGRVLDALGERQQALEALYEALPGARAAGDRAGEAYTLTSIAAVYAALGEAESALKLLDQALPIAREVGDKTSEAGVLMSMGDAHNELGRSRQALALYEKSRDLVKSLGNKPGEGYALANMSARREALGEIPQALADANASLALLREVGDRSGEAYALDVLSRSESRSGRPADAAAHLEQAMALHRALGNPVGEAQASEGLARLALSQGDLDRARGRIEEAIRISESLRARVLSSGLRQSGFASTRAAYELSIEILMRLHRRDPGAGFERRAFEASERSRARVLLELVSGGRPAAGQPALAERETELRHKLVSANERRSRLDASAPAAESEAAARQVEELLAEYERLDAQIREAAPSRAAAIRPEPLSAAEIQKELEGDAVLLEYSLGEERSFLWTVTSSDIAAHELPGRGTIETAARAVYAGLTGRRDAASAARLRKDARRLAQLVLAPADSRLAAKRILVAADGALQLVPFGALSRPSDPAAKAAALLESHEIVGLPSASAVVAARRSLSGRPRPSGVVAVLADPIFDPSDPRLPVRDRSKRAAPAPSSSLTRSASDVGLGSGPLPRLPFSRREADAILRLAPPPGGFSALDFDASRTTALGGELGRYRTVHFATHGFVDAAHPQLSGIVLSLFDRNGRPQDGFLPAVEIAGLGLSADLVVLSACRTAIGREIRGEGLIGLTRAFMASGSPRVIASLWKVDDAATAELMRRFYAALLGPARPTAADALARAERSLAREKRWAHPYYWSGFVLQGEWR